jgi:hypothetical protein
MVRLSARKKCFCAFCKSERTIFTKRRSSLSNVVASGLAAALLMMAFWQTFDPRVILIFVVFLAAAETFVQIRWRLNIVCKHCGFDPVLYLKDAGQAAEKVKVFLARRKADPASLLKPALKIPVLHRQKSADPQKPSTKAPTGRLVSKQI